jgi:RNA polymerase sigma factor for flagellar operon FliA
MAEATRDERILANLDLPRMLAARVWRRIKRRLPLDDLVEAGMLGLVKASDRFDPGQKVLFRTFANARVLGAIIDMIRSETKSRHGRKETPTVVSLGDKPELLYELRDRQPDPEVAADLAEVWKQLRCLPEREQQIIRLYYGEDLEDREIAVQFGISAARVMQIRNRALEKLRRLPENVRS